MDKIICPHCAHERDSHEVLRPMGAMELQEDTLACTDFSVDPRTGWESFCDCIWIDEPTPTLPATLEDQG